jgi:hypothetical protein
MRTALLIALLFALAAAPPALAGTATYTNGHFAFTAAPGEQNFLTLETTSDCDTLAAPCLQVSDRYDHPVAAPPGCLDEVLGIRCPIPSSVTLDTGDLLDVVDDWDGPSTIDGGADGDVIRGHGGADVLRGDDGDDTLIGGLGIHRCDSAHGKRRTRCLQRSVKRASKTCRTKFRSRARKACLREVRKVLPRRRHHA